MCYPLHVTGFWISYLHCYRFLLLNSWVFLATCFKFHVLQKKREKQSWLRGESNPRSQHRRLHLYPLLHRWLLSKSLFLVCYKKCVSCFKFHILYQTLPESCVTRCLLQVSGFVIFIVTGFSFWTLECFLLHVSGFVAILVSSFMSSRRKREKQSWLRGESNPRT